MQLDVRGPRFAAAVTSVVLVAVLLTGSGWLLLGQAAVFALTAASPRLGPYGWIFRTFVARRLGPPHEFEPAAPFRFAQSVGLAFAVAGVAGYLGGVTPLGIVAT